MSMKPAVAVLAGLIASTAHAGDDPFQFAAPVTYDIVNLFYPTCLVAGDFDEDGDDDLIITGRNSDGLMALMRGTGSGTFGPAEFIEFEAQTDWGVAGDFDGDGHLDVALAVRATPGFATILYGDGTGAFPDRQDYLAGRLPSAIIAADFDEDGWDDLAVTNYLSGSITVLRNTMTGFIETQTVQLDLVFGGGSRPISIEAADFDGDGDLDLVVSQLSTGRISFAFNERGFFGPAIALPVGTPVTLAVDDPDEDGDVDVLFADMSDFDGNLRVMENSGGFDVSEIGPSAAWTWFLTTVDLDGDGREDLAVTDAFTGRIHMHRNEGGGGVLAYSPTFFVGADEFPRFILPLDVDGDGAIDLIHCDISAHEVVVYRNLTPQAGGSATPTKDNDLDGASGTGARR